MFLAKASINRPIAMTTLLICLSIFGLLAFRNVGVDLLPQVEVPFVTIQVVYPGASPDEIETTVAKRIEDAVVQVDGIKHISSTCVNNFCQVLVEFELSRDVDVAAVDIREKVDLIREDLPDDSEAPEILKYDINAKPVVTLALTGDLPIDDLYDYADDKLADRFSSLAGVAKVELVGGEEREVVVEVDRARLAARGLTVGQVAQILSRENIKIPTGQIDDGTREVSLMFDSEAVEIPDLGTVELGVVNGERVYLRDVATFKFGTPRPKSKAFFDGKPAVVVKVTKKGEANAVSVVDGVRKVFESSAHSLPGGMVLNWVRDDGEYVNATVKDGLISIRDGVILTGIVLLLFLADIRMAFVAFVSIPVTIVIAMIAFSLFGYTLNVITMSAAGISVGILVANSIVVLENIAFAFDKCKGTQFNVGQLVERATSQVGLAVAASALTNIVVFLPITTMKSITGRFLAPFAVTVTAATFASLLISFTLTPILAMLTHQFGERFNRVLAWMLKPWLMFYTSLERGYVRSVVWMLKAPWLFVVACTVLTGFAFRYYAPKVQMDFVPQTDQGELTVKLEFPADYNLSHSEEKARAIAQKLLELKDPLGTPYIQRYTLLVGKTQGSIGQMSEGAYLVELGLVLKSKVLRPESEIQGIMEEIRAVCNRATDTIWAVMIPSVAGGASQTIEMKVSGPDLDVLNRIGMEAAAQIRNDPASADITHSVRPGRPEVRIRPNRAVLHDLGVTAQELGLSLRASVDGIEAATYKKGDRSYDIRVRFAQIPGIEQVAALNLPGPDGRPFLLGSVADMHEQLQPTQIVRAEKARTIIVYSNNAKGYGLGTALKNQEAVIRKLLPSGYTLQVGGMAEKMGETFSEFGLATLIAIILTYLLLAAIMESWTQPFIILMTIPFSYLGLYMAVYYSKTSLSMFGLLAGIMLVGVVVNAAILLIDEVNTLRRNEGYHKRDALTLAAERKFRPILMSCVAALFGMLPMATGTGLGSELRASIGIGSVGGILVSSVVSLYFIPALYVLVGQSDKSQSRRIKKDIDNIPDPVVSAEVEM
ncbi:MAG TPA: efflux RND transporter permease subunit [Kiritimatiellia bacterium]|nr:efflux RND transporter permease subunit [Kiritimatiellia bacterium]HPS05959.1 efflux RND transporter permease subunit [Kiritimatiellia bacterium]